MPSHRNVAEARQPLPYKSSGIRCNLDKLGLSYLGLYAVSCFNYKYALLVLAVIALPVCGDSDPKPQKKSAWTYSMQGNLDDDNLQCKGEAEVKKDAGNSQCWAWRVSLTDCKGSKDVDWLHESGMTDTVCPVNDRWELKKDLNGRAFCLPTVVAQGQVPVRLTLSCTWECRDAKFPCSGTATYEYHKEE